MFEAALMAMRDGRRWLLVVGGVEVKFDVARCWHLKWFAERW